jgi:hypothetical protein
MAGSMYESPHPPHVVKASDTPGHFLGIDWSSIDWFPWVWAIVTIAIVAFIMRRNRNRRRTGSSGSTDFNDTSDMRSLTRDISWGPGDHSSVGSDGGFFDGGGDASGGGHH